MNTNNIIAFPSNRGESRAEAACFDAMLHEAIEGLRYRRATRRQREERRRAQQEALNGQLSAVLSERSDLALREGACCIVSFLNAACHLKVEVTEEGQVDLSWIYDGRAEPKYSGTIGLEEARDIVLHLVAVRLASLHVEGEQSAG
jgi:hypothetical protein